jgi:hypothetical protein
MSSPRPRLRWIALLCVIGCAGAFAQSRPPDTTSGAPVTWLIFIDDLHLEFRNTGRIRNMMKTIVSELIQDGGRFAMASSGPSAINLDPTTDRQLLDAAIRKTTGNALKYQDIQAANSTDEVKYRAVIAITTADEFLRNARSLPSGPKAMLFISNGYSFTPPDILGRLASLTATATKSAVRIFAIDPRASFNDSGYEMLLDAGWDAHLAARQRSLRSLSDTTAGFAILDGHFDTQVRRIRSSLPNR